MHNIRGYTYHPASPHTGKLGYPLPTLTHGDAPHTPRHGGVGSSLSLLENIPLTFDPHPPQALFLVAHLFPLLFVLTIGPTYTHSIQHTYMLMRETIVCISTSLSVKSSQLPVHAERQLFPAHHNQRYTYRSGFPSMSVWNDA